MRRIRGCDIRSVMASAERKDSEARQKLWRASWTERYRTLTPSGEQFVELSSDLKLTDIPVIYKSCLDCGGDLQREIHEMEIEGKDLIVSSYGMPGYGCTSCGVKCFDSDALVGFNKSALEQFRLVNDAGKVDILERAIELSERRRALSV